VNAQGSFGAWLRYERERRNISIASIADSTKILGALFVGLENDDLSRWPEGFYRRAFVRAYARAIGLDPERVVREFLLHFPEPDGRPATPVPDSSTQTTLLRLTLADTGQWFRGGRRVRPIGLRCAAAALDAAVIGALSGCVWLTMDVFWPALGLIACGYYLASILILGNTPGVCTFASGTHDDGGETVLRRAQGYILRLINPDDARTRIDERTVRGAHPDPHISTLTPSWEHQSRQ